MGAHINAERAEEISKVLFDDFEDKPEDTFLRAELERYVPLLSKASEAEIRKFSGYHRSIYLDFADPIIGRPIASLNPTFIDGLDSIDLKKKIYTRASTKENGYRFQLHNGLRVGQSYAEFLHTPGSSHPMISGCFQSSRQ